MPTEHDDTDDEQPRQYKLTVTATGTVGQGTAPQPPPNEEQ